MAGALKISGAAEISIKPTSERPLVLNMQTCQQEASPCMELGQEGIPGSCSGAGCAAAHTALAGKTTYNL